MAIRQYLWTFSPIKCLKYQVCYGVEYMTFKGVEKLEPYLWYSKSVSSVARVTRSCSAELLVPKLESIFLVETRELYSIKSYRKVEHLLQLELLYSA
jgi:hypothetical protein